MLIKKTIFEKIITFLLRKERYSFVLVQLNFPNFEFRLRKNANRNEIFDEIRKKWLVCTPEEWVRQHMLKWLITEKNYPASHFMVESGLKINQLAKRTDILFFHNRKPLLLVECKAPQVPVNQSVFDQLFRYNSQLNAPLLAVTNGQKHVFAIINGGQMHFLEKLPDYETAKQIG